ncbi:MAG: hypothetical protein ACI9UA_003083 [Pseudoalteromonas tetraodonis]|jgi:hypothetical protein
MILKNRSISRRTVLRAAGVTLALPLLELMGGRTRAATAAVKNPPLRTAFFYIPNGVVQRSWHPRETGKNFTLSPTLEPLAPVRDKITLLTKLDRIKVAGTDGHAQAGACYLSSAAPDELSPAGYPLKTTIDQIIAAETGKHTAFRSLELSCNPYEDNKESIYFDNISWYGHGHVARSLRDPLAVFNRLFAVEGHAAHGSVLDLVMEEAKSLDRELGRADSDKLDEYLDSVRTVERQIERVAKRQAEIDGLNLAPPTKPWQAMERGEFINVMGDLMILALQTDLTRVATLMSSPERWGTPLMVHGIFDKPIQHHGMTHGQGNEKVRRELEKLDRFHVEQFASLVKKMDAIKEGEGTLLDHTMFTLGSGLSDASLHVCTDLPTVIAGRAGGAIDSGAHIKSPEGTPIANLWLTMAQTMGVKLDHVGDSTGTLNLT